MGLFDALFGGGYKTRARRDQHSLGTSLKNLISPINHYGKCFACNGSGRRAFDCDTCAGTGTYTGLCRTCEGSGTFTYAPRPCATCDATGFVKGTGCRHCNGSGVFRSAYTATCKKCDGTGSFTATCRRCEGTGDFNPICRKCDGSGWYRF